MNRILILALGVAAFIVTGYFLSRQIISAPVDIGGLKTNKIAKQPLTDNDFQVMSGSMIDLSGKSLSAIPSDIFNRTDLVELDISHNSIKGAIQGEIRLLKNLRVLNASNNQMTGVPAEIGQLENLEILNLSNNKITGLPLELGNLKRIKVINLSGNDYSKYDLDLIRSKLPGVNFILN